LSSLSPGILVAHSHRIIPGSGKCLKPESGGIRHLPDGGGRPSIQSPAAMQYCRREHGHRVLRRVVHARCFMRQKSSASTNAKWAASPPKALENGDLVWYMDQTCVVCVCEGNQNPPPSRCLFGRQDQIGDCDARVLSSEPISPAHRRPFSLSRRRPVGGRRFPPYLPGLSP
jgi:hypothetical protein